MANQPAIQLCLFPLLAAATLSTSGFSCTSRSGLILFPAMTDPPEPDTFLGGDDALSAEEDGVAAFAALARPGDSGVPFSSGWRCCAATTVAAGLCCAAWAEKPLKKEARGDAMPGLIWPVLGAADGGGPRYMLLTTCAAGHSDVVRRCSALVLMRWLLERVSGMLGAVLGSSVTLLLLLGCACVCGAM